MNCRWCKQDISTDAKVCHHCGRHQGVVGSIVALGGIVGVVVALLGATLSTYQAIQTRTDTATVEQAVDAAALALSKSQGNAERAEQAESAIKNMAGGIAELAWQHLSEVHQAMMAGRDCEDQECRRDLRTTVKALQSYFDAFVRTNGEMTNDGTDRLRVFWCNSVARVFFYYKDYDEPLKLAKTFIESCEDANATTVKSVRQRFLSSDQ